MIEHARSSAGKGVTAAICGSFFGAAFLIPWKMAGQHGSPQVTVLLLLSAAAVLNTLAAAVSSLRSQRRSETARPWGPTLALGAVLAVLTYLGNLASAESVFRISGALLSVLQRSEVLLVAILGWISLGERVRAPFWLGTFIAGFGLVVLQRQDLAGSDAEFDPVGVAYGIGSALCFGTMIVLTRRYIARVRVLPLNAVRLWLSVALWFAVNQRMPSAVEAPLTLVGLASAAAFFGPFLSRLCVLISARHVAANITAFASLATPVLTLLLAFTVLGTLPTGRELLGGGIMLTGIAVPILAALWRTRQ